MRKFLMAAALAWILSLMWFATGAGQQPSGGQPPTDRQVGTTGTATAPVSRPLSGFDATIRSHAERMIDEGRQIFRYDTFGDESFWGDQLQLHKGRASADLLPASWLVAPVNIDLPHQADGTDSAEARR